jgi:hypothetical protein
MATRQAITDIPSMLFSPAKSSLFVHESAGQARMLALIGKATREVISFQLESTGWEFLGFRL